MAKPVVTPLRRKLTDGELAANLRPAPEEQRSLSNDLKKIDSYDIAEQRRLVALLRSYGRRQAIEDLKGLREPNDEIWEFDTPQEAWDQGMGLRGFEIVRGDESIKRIITAMN